MSISGNLLINDLNQHIIQMDLDYFPFPWMPNHWSELDLNHHRLYSWKKNNELEGFSLFQILEGDDTAHLLKIVVPLHLRGSGVIDFFWSEILTDLKRLYVKKIYLEVQSSNLRAISFYKKNNFTSIRCNKSYYSNGDDSEVMLLTL